jgi:Amidohydrolase family
MNGSMRPAALAATAGRAGGRPAAPVTDVVKILYAPTVSWPCHGLAGRCRCAPPSCWPWWRRVRGHAPGRRRGTAASHPENDRLDDEPVLAEAAAAEEAHRQGLPITAHAHGRDGIVAALQARVDGVEHASFLAPGGPQPDPRVIEALAASGTFIPTCIPGTVPGIPLPPIIAAIVDGARALTGSLIEGGTRVVIGPDAGIAPTSRTMCSRTPLPT